MLGGPEGSRGFTQTSFSYLESLCVLGTLDWKKHAMWLVQKLPCNVTCLVLMLDTNQLWSHTSQQHQQNADEKALFGGEFLAQDKRQ